MEPNKFDKIVKEKLEQRTIQPREMAWDRLDAMLSVAEEKTAKPRKSRTWMYIAASFLGFLLLGTIFLKQGSDKNTEVNNTDVQVAVTPEPRPTVKQENANETVETVITTPTEIRVEETMAATRSKITVKPNTTKAVKDNKVIAPAPVIDEEAVAQVNQNEVVFDKQVTNNEAETLLAAAADTDESKKPNVKVNAKSLLSSVEGELDNSFRSKAMQTIVKNYNTVKTSVANRNHK